RYAQESADTRELGSSAVHWVVDGSLIGDMDKTGSVDELPMGVVWIGLVPLAYQLVEFRGETASRQGAQPLAIPYLQGANGHPTEAVRLLQYGVEHRREVAG